MSKKHKPNPHCNPDECIGSCFDCDNACYICEGDFLCHFDDTPVITDWVPTKDYYKCGGKHYKPV